MTALWITVAILLVVGHHWATMHPIKDGELTDEERTTLNSEAQA
jgi:hypothetical protein